MVVIDTHEIFKQLAFARYGQGPLAKFGDWKDGELWVRLLDVLQERRSFKQDLNSIISVILKYPKNYVDDPGVNWIVDDTLKNNIVAVFSFEPLMDKKGHISIDRLEVIQHMNDTRCIDIYEQVGENSFSPGGRNLVERFRGAGSSSGNNLQLKSLLNRLNQILNK
ncbi:unnamed protein product [Lathyrus oleraceus]